MRLAADDHLVQALATQCANQTFRNAILPRRSRRDRPVADTHRPHPRREDMSVGTVIVAHQISRRRCPGKRLGDLPGQPLSSRMPHHLEPQQLSPVMAHDQKRKQTIKGQRRNDAHIDCGDHLSVISKKCLPGLRMSAVFTHPEIAPKRLAWLADNAVSCQPVSEPISLLTGKFTGNFAKNRPLAR